jgi:hypothetical protein
VSQKVEIGHDGTAAALAGNFKASVDLSPSGIFV